jgi:beta-ketoadipate pathway transcriptional regulators, PcaR/PcaU/PobR family
VNQEPGAVGVDSPSTPREADGPLPTPPARSADFVQSLERGLAVIKAFDANDAALTLSDVARKTGLTRAAARRFLHTLEQLGYVRSDGRLFSLRPRVLELGYAYLSGQTLPEVAQPHMEHYTSRVHESTSISVLDGDDIVYVARVEAKRIMRVAITIGTRLPAYATSMGRVLLAHAPQDWLDDYLARVELVQATPQTVATRDELAAVLAGVRADGYALVDQELEIGLRSLAVPIHAPSGQTVAAMNTSTDARRGTPQDVLTELLPVLRETAASIEADLHVNA